MPAPLVLLNLLILAAVVFTNHHPEAFLGLFLLFLGLAEAYRRHHDRLLLREGLMVAFFLAGLVVLGGQQRWWLQDVLSRLDETTLFYGAAALTAITDNALLTYLGSLVEGVTADYKYALVAGAVAGGGLTVIANAPNPAGFAILKDSFEDQSINRARTVPRGAAADPRGGDLLPRHPRPGGRILRRRRPGRFGSSTSTARSSSCSSFRSWSPRLACGRPIATREVAVRSPPACRARPRSWSGC